MDGKGRTAFGMGDKKIPIKRWMRRLLLSILLVCDLLWAGCRMQMLAWYDDGKGRQSSGTHETKKYQSERRMGGMFLFVMLFL